MTLCYFKSISVLTFILYTKSIILVIHKGIGFNFNINGFHALLFAARLSAYNSPKIKKKKKKNSEKSSGVVHAGWNVKIFYQSIQALALTVSALAREVLAWEDLWKKKPREK